MRECITLKTIHLKKIKATKTAIFCKKIFEMLEDSENYLTPLLLFCENKFLLLSHYIQQPINHIHDRQQIIFFGS